MRKNLQDGIHFILKQSTFVMIKKIGVPFHRQ